MAFAQIHVCEYTMKEIYKLRNLIIAWALARISGNLHKPQHTTNYTAAHRGYLNRT